MSGNTGARSALRRGAIDRPGSVHPRVAQTVIGDGAFCDATIFQEYYGGLLCASKDEAQSDAAAPYLAILKGMSTLQLRMHFLCYALVHINQYENVPNLLLQESRDTFFIVAPFPKLFAFLEQDEADYEAVLSHLVSGLQRMNLIGPYYQFGPPEYLKHKLPEYDWTERCLVLTPSVLGAELFLYAAGVSKRSPNAIFNRDHDLLASFPAELREAL